MEDAFEVRLLRPEDGEAAWRLFEECHVDPADQPGDKKAIDAYMAHVFEVEFEGGLALAYGGDGAQFWVAEERSTGVLAAMVGVRKRAKDTDAGSWEREEVGNHDDARPRAGDCELNRMAVGRAFRRRGLARALVEEMLVPWCREQGYTRCHLTTLVEMGKAIGMWERLGWRQTVSYEVFPGGHVMHMLRDL